MQVFLAYDKIGKKNLHWQVFLAFFFLAGKTCIGKTCIGKFFLNSRFPLFLRFYVYLNHSKYFRMKNKKFWKICSASFSCHLASFVTALVPMGVFRKKFWRWQKILEKNQLGPLRCLFSLNKIFALIERAIGRKSWIQEKLVLCNFSWIRQVFLALNKFFLPYWHRQEKPA